MIKWICKPSGLCPVQAEGYFKGKYFYFRSRWNKATIDFAESKEEWENGGLLKTYQVFDSGDSYGAGWLPKWFCKVLIYRGCFKYLLNRKSDK